MAKGKTSQKQYQNKNKKRKKNNKEGRKFDGALNY